MLAVMLLTSKGAAGVIGQRVRRARRDAADHSRLPLAGVALLVGIDRFMSEASALTSAISNAVAVIFVSMWERACDREVLHRELDRNYATTEESLEEAQVIDSPLAPGRATAG